MYSCSRKFGYYIAFNESPVDVKRAEFLQEYVFERDIFFDSCANMDRPNLKKMFQQLKPGDVVYFYTLDGLFKNNSTTKQMLELFRQNKVAIRILDLPSTVVDSQFFYSEEKSFSEVVMDFVMDMVTKEANKEHLATKNRQAMGFNEAKKNGIKLGRKAKPLPDTFEADYNDWKNGKCTAASIYKRYGWSNPCFYRRVKQYEMSLIA